MKISIKYLSVLFAILLFSVMANAQGSGSSEPKKDRKENNFAVTRSVSGVVTSASGSSIVVKRKNGKTISLSVTKNTRTRRGCLSRGRNVTVIYTPKDRTATIIRCTKAS